MTEPQQTEMDSSDPLRLLSVEGGLGHTQDLRLMTESALSWGLGTWINSRLCCQLATGDWTSCFSSPSLTFPLLPPTSWLYDQGKSFPISMPQFPYQALPQLAVT